LRDSTDHLAAADAFEMRRRQTAMKYRYRDF
jgi:hypothetical protein